jgi:GNAT superfamily N-acetyltransferase
MINRQTYLENPCRHASIPYWKIETRGIPEHIRIHHMDDCDCDASDQVNRETYFRLSHHLTHLVDEDSSIRTIDPKKDIERLAKMINQSYHSEGIKVTSQDLISFMMHPVYQSDLWIKIEKEGQIIASGIAEFDSKLKEGVLEWIQVIPEAQGQGYGQKIVQALLSRLSNRALFVTVSGRLGNLSNPEKRYRQAGFEGNDIWHVIRSTSSSPKHKKQSDL